MTPDLEAALRSIRKSLAMWEADAPARKPFAKVLIHESDALAIIAYVDTPAENEAAR